MKPAPKTKPINDLLSAMLGKDREATIQGDTCIVCGKLATTFKDDLSRREYSISGMCKTCQDGFFERENE